MQNIRNILHKQTSYPYTTTRTSGKANSSGKLISLQFNGKNYLETHGTAMGTKMAVAFSDIFMNKVETDILSQSELKPLVWKRFIDDIFSLWTINRDQEP